MSTRSIILVITLFVIIVIGMVIFAVLKSHELTTSPAYVVVATSTKSTNSYGINKIEGTHYFNDGVHTVAGELRMPTPCDLLDATATVTDNGLNVTLTFNVINRSDYCAQVETESRFKVSATAAKEANFTATFMGQPVILNLIEARLNEKPNES